MKSNQLETRPACLHNAMFAYKQQFAVTNLALVIRANQVKSG